MTELIRNNWTNPVAESQQLSRFSTGAVAPPDIASDLAKAYKVGEESYLKFKRDRLEEGSSKVKFHDKLTKHQLKTFSHMTKTKKVITSSGTETVLRTDRNLFARMIIIAESRKLQMQDVLNHPLGPLPSALATNNGLPRKTSKSQLGKELEKLIQPSVEVPRPSAYLIDGMALVQKLKVDYLTFGEIADMALCRVLLKGDGSKRIDVVFDVYRELSIKSIERAQRGEGDAITFKRQFL